MGNHLYCIPSNWSVQNRTFHDRWVLISALFACPIGTISTSIEHHWNLPRMHATSIRSGRFRAQMNASKPWLVFFSKTDRRDSWSIYCKICIIWAKLENWKLKCHQWWWSTFYYLCVCLVPTKTKCEAQAIALDYLDRSNETRTKVRL